MRIVIMIVPPMPMAGFKLVAIWLSGRGDALMTMTVQQENKECPLQKCLHIMSVNNT
jgi:hypothetical protein